MQTPSFSSLPIKRKIVLIIMLISGSVMLLSCMALVAFDVFWFRANMVTDLTALAETIAANNAVKLLTDNKEAAESSMAVLKAKPNITACIYTTNGIFATYPTNAAPIVPQTLEPTSHRFDNRRLVIFEPIVFNGRQIGNVYLESTLKQLWSTVGKFSLVVAVIFAGAFFPAFLLSTKLQRLISEPILELTKATRTVSEEKNYSIRAVKRTEDEVGFLIDGFNGMLGQIEKREKALEEANQQLVQSEHKAMSATQAKSAFLANMSHELRTPLNAIIGFSEILADKTFGEFNEKQGRYVQNILTSGRHLLQLINDILDLAKIEAGKLVLDPSSFEVATALRDVQVIVSTLANKKRITLDVEVQPNIPAVFADQPKFKQVMYNLLSNAIKFTPDGGRVTIRASVQEDDSPGRLEETQTSAGDAPPKPNRFLRVSVSDTGIGIKPEHHETVFNEFEQVDSSYGRQQHGTGLGLSLTRKLVELHGGRIWLESEGIESKGSTFIFVFPITHPEKPSQTPLSAERAMQDSHEPPVSREPPGGSTVLVVEDEQHGGELLQEYLTAGGYQVAHAWDGEQAVKLARELRPVAITLDILLPKKNGWEVLGELKADPATKDIPVVIVSVTNDRQLGFSLGAIEYFVKPVSKDQLLAAIRQASRATGRAVRTVLVVDDDPMTVEFLSANVGAAGYEVLVAHGGQQGMDLAAKHMPDLIILDLMMPEVSGFEVVQLLRQEARTKDIPVLIYTAKELTEEDRRELRDRVQSITLKSGKQDLLREVDRLAKLKQSPHL